ncbi:spermidine synthase [Candidatus Magnetomoraceae bacterium gMMP-15]
MISLKKNEKKDHIIVWAVIFTGISSVIAQLITIREFLAQFQGNEFVISLILFVWLVMGGFGSLLARTTSTKSKGKYHNLGPVCLVLAILPMIQIIAVRQLRDLFFIHGTSAGFYGILGYVLLIITPYTLLLGFALPYSLFVARTIWPDYPGSRIYIMDNLGDAGGGALFSFILVYLVTPFTAILLSNLPLIGITIYFIIKTYYSDKISFSGRIIMILLFILICTLFFMAVHFERATLSPSKGKLVHYKESRYGRIEVHQDHDQFTLFQAGLPVFSTQNQFIAEEIIHYPLSQLDKPKNILLISAEGGVMNELEKYKPESIDYIELDPELSEAQFKFNLIKKIPLLNVINIDGRLFLSQTKKQYDIIILNLPEPDTFQVNRFYTDSFFKLAKDRLRPGGLLSFCMNGFDSYISEINRQKLSSIYNTVSLHFKHVLILPGQRNFFLCKDESIKTDIPFLLSKKNIQTQYISGFYKGNITQDRIDYVNNLINASAPENTDFSPYLIRVMFSEWFAKFAASPIWFIVILMCFLIIYIMRISCEEFVLFSTGFTVMGSEILVIFAFQAFFGYIYFQIGIIITLFLLGLFPGAVMGEKWRSKGRSVLAVADISIIILMSIFIIALIIIKDDLPDIFFLIFGFLISVACGFQFPVALHLRDSSKSNATSVFASDLIGAAVGTLFVSVLFIPFFGIVWTALLLIGLKCISLGILRIPTFAGITNL